VKVGAKKEEKLLFQEEIFRFYLLTNLVPFKTLILSNISLLLKNLFQTPKFSTTDPKIFCLEMFKNTGNFSFCLVKSFKNGNSKYFLRISNLLFECLALKEKNWFY